MNEEEEYYKKKKQEFLDEEAKYTDEEIIEMRTRAYSLISESITKNQGDFPGMSPDVVEKWTLVKRMFSHPILDNITETIKAYESAISTLKQLTPTGIHAWSRKDAIEFLWNDIDHGKASLKTALKYINLDSIKEFD